MWITFISSKLLQVIKGAPVLDSCNPTQIEEGLRSQKPLLWMLVESAKHWPHGHRRRDPLVEGEETIDAHSNNKNNKRFICLSCISPRDNFSHRNKFPFVIVSAHTLTRYVH